MIAIIQTGGKQYLVKEGEVITVGRLVDAKAGDKVEFDVMFTADASNNIKLGAPLLEGKVMGEVVGEFRTKKIEVVKYKAKSRYTRRVGHRQHMTKVKITKV